MSIDLTTHSLGGDARRAAKNLARCPHQSWLRNAGHGLYVPVPFDLANSESEIADPWVLVPTLFGQCYVGGWTAALHWNLTEQLFDKTVVFATRRIVEKRVSRQDVIFLVHKIPLERVFGLQTLWRGSTRIAISDAARTLVDMIAIPQTGGGIDHVTECVRTYLGSENADPGLLIRYAEQFGNGAIFKRLGFLAETRLHDREIVAACRARLTQGYARLDSAVACPRFVTSWRLWVPSGKISPRDAKVSPFA